MDSIFDRDEDRIFSASAAACGFKGMPSAGASVVFRTYVVEKRSIEFKSHNSPEERDIDMHNLLHKHM